MVVVFTGWMKMLLGLCEAGAKMLVKMAAVVAAFNSGLVISTACFLL